MDRVITFRIQDPELYWRLCREAEQRGTTVSTLIRAAIEDFIKSLNKEKKENG